MFIRAHGRFLLAPVFIASAVEAFRLRVTNVIFALLVLTNRWQFGLFIFCLTKCEMK